MLKITLKCGEVVTGTSNHVTETDAEIRTGSGGFRTIARADVMSVTRERRRDIRACNRGTCGYCHACQSE